MKDNPQSKPLRRSLTFPMMVLYGLGTTIGAGIYALVGELAGVAGYYAPFSFLIASLLAGFTALSFAELSGRYPRAAGAALYVQQGFRHKGFSTVIGLLVALAGIVSSAALINGFIGYFHEFFQVERWIIVLILCLAIGGLAAWGITQSVIIASVFTLIEIGGLLVVIYMGHGEIINIGSNLEKIIPPIRFDHSGLLIWGGIFSGTLLAFYAYIGFEDMVDVAEEVKQVRRTMPYAILTTLVITTILYLLVMLVAVFAMPPSELAKSKAPLAAIFSQYSSKDSSIISLIGLFAIINGALIQVIMASRVLYGLSSRKQLPGIFGRVNETTQTPLFSTFLVILIVLVLALLGSLGGLAQGTSILMLSVFAMVNFSLWLIKRRERKPELMPEEGVTHGAITIPKWIPLLGFVVSTGFVLKEVFGLLLNWS